MKEALFSKERLEAVVFDLDGVICFTDRLHFRAWKQLTDRLGLPFDETINDRLRGIGRMASLEIILESAGRDCSPEEKAAFAAEKNERYRELLSSMTPADLSDEVRDTLRALRGRGYLLAVGSSSRNTKLILERIGLDGFFDAVADGADLRRSKPDPEVFLIAAKRLGAAPSRCAVVEDAKAAGMIALALGGDAAGCGLEDYDLGSFSELLEIL